MAKVASKYLKVDPWKIIEDGFHPEKSRISESMFSLANEYMGVRGYFDERYSGDQLVGSYINGLYEEMPINHPQVFKGLRTRRAFNVNTVNWLYTRIAVDGEQLDLNESKFSDFQRVLEMKTNTLKRSFVWETKAGKKIEITFIRFLNISNSNTGCQRIRFKSLKGKAEVEITSGLDFSPPHEIASGWSQVKKKGPQQAGKNFWSCPCNQKSGDIYAMMGKTESTGQWLFSSFEIDAQLNDTQLVQEDKLIAVKGKLILEENKENVLNKVVTNYWQRDNSISQKQAWNDGLKLAQANSSLTFDTAYQAHCDEWEKIWDRIDIEIDGDDELQQGTRFSISQMYQTYQGKDPSINIPCKGLTAEVYYGWMFWDSETYCLPFYMFNDPKGAKSLLLYRYIYLPQARERARELGCEGARYPFATIDGTECCGTWQHCDLEIHVDVGVSYAIWHYMKICNDTEFLYKEGIEMLLEICRYLASRGEWGRQTGLFGFFGVMGPDEFHTMVHNNCYTNYMAKKTFEYTLDVINEMKENAPKALKDVTSKISLKDSELADWKKMAEKMKIPYDEKTRMFEQHDGYFDLPDVDVKNLPPDQIPIYANWVYEKIFRHNMIKQPDFLLLPLFFSEEFTMEQKKKNYEFYESKTIHESSLSPSIHSILANEIGNHDHTYEFFRYTARLDLDNYNNNTEQGLHTTAMSGVWLNMVMGFGGLRTDGDVISFKPSIPDQWNAYRFRLLYKGALLEIGINKQKATFTKLEGSPVDIKIYDKKHTIDDSVEVEIKQLG